MEIDYEYKNHISLGMPVYKHPFLPIDKTIKVCCLITRTEVDLHTGEKIHMFKLGNSLFLSNEAYQELLTPTDKQ